ncbi:unnamed protein product [Paramecium primaurelia]|uniref:Insulin-like growth factor binding protein, N-terminal n=1 Tax=Paramecium primaurelia TaxID=5886 RepID=A0A8S1NJK9_PARPR|nr:unnamed protein product [Paramecium primaurelia]
MRSKCQDLYYESFTTNTFTTDEGKSLQQQGWNLKGQYGIYSDCGPTRLFGGYQNFANGTSITLLKQLPPHYSIKISFDFWNGTFDISGTPICGLTNWDERIVQIERELLHAYQSVLILMTSDLSSLDVKLSYKPRNFGEFETLNFIFILVLQVAKYVIQEIPELIAYLLDADLDQLVIDGWEIQNGCQQKSYCASMPILGGQGCFGKGTILTRRLNLPPHDKLKLKLRYIFIDTWDNEFTQILIDDTIINTYPYYYGNQVIRNLCGQIFNEKNQLLEFTISHTSSQATLKIINNLDQGLINESFGIRDFQIFIACVFGDSFNQACGVICGNGIKEGSEQCDDGNIYPYDGCFNCEYSCVEGCSTCVFGVCFECEDFYEIQPYFNTCTPNLMDKKISLWETCDDELNYLTCKDGKFFCPYNCQFCIFGQCQICIENYELINNQCEPICQEQFFTNDIECQDFNLFAFDQCHQCSFELEEGCSLHSHGQCIQCQEGWELDEEQSKCRPICGDFNIRGDEQCDYYQIKSYKQVYRCEFCKYTCQPECIDCQFGMCYECSTGWEIRNFKCETICNDNLINGLEDCDDSNTIKFDGCHQCHNDCQQECSYCYRGVCLECIFGWRLTQEFKCQSNCGDGLVALISIEQCDDSNLIQFDGCHLCQLEQFCGDGIISIPEQCDDMNDIPYDGCFQCLYQCELDCEFCNQGVCQIDCETGYQIIDNQCQEVCGDGIITISEQCDDMNQTPYDGCFQCFYQCELDCEFCNEGICQKDCEHGYQFIGNQCQEVCGDGIVTNSEQCDDMNDIPYDGCYKCEIECSNNCQLCQQGQCILCNESYALSQMENQCKSICGDGILKDDEECDDKNFIDNDGCSKNCKIEQDFVCKNFEYTFTLCTYKQYPKFQATLLNQISFNSQYVKLNFDQLVKTKLNGSIIDQIQANILDLSLESYQINILSLQDASQTLSQVEYIVEILFKTQLAHIPILEVKLLDQLYNEYDSPLINQYLTIRLLQSKYLDEQELQSAIYVKDSAYYALMIIGGSGFVLFFSGSSLFISAILEILQQQSYLRFINVAFPLNLFTYFELTYIEQGLVQFFLYICNWREFC